MAKRRERESIEESAIHFNFIKLSLKLTEVMRIPIVFLNCITTFVIRISTVFVIYFGAARC